MADSAEGDSVLYRLFRINAAGEAQGSPVTIKAESDDDAVRHARRVAGDTGAFLCKGTRFIAGWSAVEAEKLSHS